MQGAKCANACYAQPSQVMPDPFRDADFRVPILRLAVKYSRVPCRMFNFWPDTEWPTIHSER